MTRTKWWEKPPLLHVEHYVGTYYVGYLDYYDGAPAQLGVRAF